MSSVSVQHAYSRTYTPSPDVKTIELLLPVKLDDYFGDDMGYWNRSHVQGLTLDL